MLVLLDGAIIVLVIAIITVLHGRAAARMVRGRGVARPVRREKPARARRCGTHTAEYRAAHLDDTRPFQAVA